MSSQMNDQTVGGLLAYCDWLKEKGYHSPNAVEAWKTAVKKVFETVDGEDYASVSLDGLDVDSHVQRFQTLAGANYKAETVSVYGKRIKNAIEAHEFYLENGKPPTFRQPRARTTEKAQPAKAQKPTDLGSRRGGPTKKVLTEDDTERYEFSYPLSYGMAHVSLPMPLSRRDIERLTTVLSTLEEAPQIPAVTGEVHAA